MVEQIVFTLRARSRGIHLVTSEIIGRLPALPEKGLLHLLIRHTSAALALNENADPDVRHDLSAIFDRLVPENAPSIFTQTKGRTICRLMPKRSLSVHRSQCPFLPTD